MYCVSLIKSVFFKFQISPDRYFPFNVVLTNMRQNADECDVLMFRKQCSFFTPRQPEMFYKEIKIKLNPTETLDLAQQICLMD